MTSHSNLCAATIAAALLLTACGGGAGSSSPALPSLPPPKAGNHFTHVVILVQENRTFDNLFATFPGADGTTVGKTHNGTLALRKANLESAISPNNGYQYWLQDYNGGRMNGFDQVPIGQTPGTYVYEYVDPAQIGPYWSLAKQYVLADHVFQTQGSGSFTAHQDLIAGGTEVDPSDSLIDFPSRPPWGCDSPSGTVTTLITKTNIYKAYQGPFPCLNYETLRDRLDAQGISWRYYAPQFGQSFGGDLWNAFDAIKAVRDGPEWGRNVVWPETDIFKDIAGDTLPAVSWVIPDYQNSDHPGDDSDTGPSWVAQVVNAIGKSPAWKTTAILVVWDDWGGWYDHVAPPGTRTFGGLGFRVPLLAISPYAKRGYVSHSQYELGSIVKFVESNWNLPSLGTTDVRAADFTGDFFDFAQTPRTFVPIQAKYSRTFFERQRPSNHPVDNE
ncbi:MAG TPA: alkaline phosphatase family protein [Candidatus Tumulicola sp.]|nr:alkaline phosphatase family protein [Candidatus Tumulicola sp.]